MCTCRIREKCPLRHSWRVTAKTFRKITPAVVDQILVEQASVERVAQLGRVLVCPAARCKVCTNSGSTDVHRFLGLQNARTDMQNQWIIDLLTLTFTLTSSGMSVMFVLSPCSSTKEDGENNVIRQGGGGVGPSRCENKCEVLWKEKKSGLVCLESVSPCEGEIGRVPKMHFIYECACVRAGMRADEDRTRLK